MYRYHVPKGYFVTSGRGVDGLSDLNAFDRALQDADLAGSNLVSVSSIIPKDAKEVKPVSMLPGSITFCVMSREDGISDELISCGLSWGMCKDGDGRRYGIVAEEHGHVTSESIRKKVKSNLYRMAETRSMDLSNFKTEVISLKVDEEYGSVVVIFVYLF